MATELNPFVVEVMATPGGSQVLQCYQCGTCSGSCPVLEEMEHGPRRIMYLVQNGFKDEVLSSHDMWYCVSCYACASRCPRGIEITDVMASLRTLALTQGYAEDQEAEFGQAFSGTFKTHGRLFEPELMLRYYLRTWDIKGLLGMLPLGLRMLFKGKLPLFPEGIEEPAQVRKLAEGPAGAPPPVRKAPQAERPAWRPWFVGAAVTLLSAVVSAGLWLGGKRGGRS